MKQPKARPPRAYYQPSLLLTKVSEKTLEESPETKTFIDSPFKNTYDRSSNIAITPYRYEASPNAKTNKKNQR